LCQAKKTSLESGHRCRNPQARASYVGRTEAMDLSLDLLERQVSNYDSPADTAIAKVTLEDWLDAQSPDRQALVNDLATLGVDGTAKKRRMRKDTIHAIKRKAMADYLLATT